MGTLKLDIYNMKHIIFCSLAFIIAFSTFISADDHANACTEADNPSSFALCQTLRTYCATTIAACDGNSLCLATVTTVYETYAATFSLADVTDCDCAAFTCDENFSDDSGSNNGAFGLAASLGMVLIMRVFG